MARRLSKVGTNSGNGNCPTLYEVPGTDDYVVQGDTVTDPAELTQLHRPTERESAVVVPRELLANFGPKEPVRVAQWISPEEFGEMFTTLEHSVWGLETRRRYASDGRTRARAGRPAPGRRFERVRLVDTVDAPDPAGSGPRARAGEDLRILSRERAAELALPEGDFWIFDSRVVALPRFGADDGTTRVELITNPVDVLRYAQAREAAWHHAVP
ncbi:DUF6879 family protein [Streptomyces sp. IB2014 016-6]|uniref:DUF6879 family protein n=1 Tax=Streptomyces sp. IB2014 016-6 TaxID=2517818 RepID=UPI0011CC6D6B|nr:DUF6879 family protein [Streptomyces sp. IB2014 016-6]TXL91729.1 hypothetical protein EW053_05285 [Streptomyces sp. IB2014 016-6]